MFSLPAEISNNKDLVSYKPILFIDFYTKIYHVATQEYDLQTGISGSDGVLDLGVGLDYFNSSSATFITDGVQTGEMINIDGDEYEIIGIESETRIEISPVAAGAGTGLSYYIFERYLDLIDKNYNFSIDSSIPKSVNGISGTSTAGFRLLSWREELRGNLIGSNPDLTDSIVDLYLKFNTANYLKSNCIQLNRGKITSWDEAKDKMTISLKNTDEIQALSDLPGALLSDTYSMNTLGELCKPIQFGDFALDTQFEFWSEFGDNLACCPYVGVVDGYYRVVVSGHEMNDVPSTADLSNYYEDPHCFIRKDGLFIVANISYITSTITNNSSGCYIDFLTFLVDRGLAYLPPKDEYTDEYFAGRQNAVTNWEDAIDGSSSTFCSIEAGDEDRLCVHNFKVIEKCGNMRTSVNVSMYISIHFGDIDLSGDGDISLILREKGVGDHTTVHAITAAEDNVQKTYLWTGLADTVNMDDYAVCIICTASTGTAACDIKNLIGEIEVEENSMSDISEIYIKAKGKEYSGTWNTRKTAGNLIQNPADAMECIIRDYFSDGDDDIDMPSFDDVNTIFSSIDIRASIIDRISAESFLSDFCNAFNVALIKSVIGKWRLIFPQAAGLTFANSGTSTPGAEDIFTDTDIISSNEFTNNPIDKDSFSISRNSEKEVFSQLEIFFAKNKDEFAASVSQGSSGNKKEIKNYFIGDSTSANALKSLVFNWISTQKCIASFKTYYNAIAFELGDVVNIRHADLNDDILDATVNTQKWLVINNNFDYHPSKISISAIELL